MNTRNWAFNAFIWLFFLIYSFCVRGQGKFIQNVGQWNTNIASRAEISGGAIYLCKSRVIYNFVDTRDFKLLHADPYHTDTCSVHGQAFFLDWVNPNKSVDIISQDEYPEYYNYFIGNDSSKWKSGVHAYSNVSYQNLYEGINLSLNAEGADLEYTYTVSPRADVSLIKIKISGAEGVYVQGGDLHINSHLVQIIEKSPYAYQIINGKQVAVACNFNVSNGSIESFELPDGYDKSQPLIIDPVVIFASYSGSKADNFGFTGTYDAKGYAYSGGDVYGAGYPTTPGAYQDTFQGGQDYSTYPGDPGYIEIQVLGFSPRDVAILKYTPDGKNLVYATYLGGKKGNEQPHSMVVDKSGNLVVFGTTASSDFPVTSSAYKPLFGGKTDLFVSKFSPDGKKLLASTFMGGSGFDGLNGINTWHDSKGYVILDAGTPLCYNYGDQFRGEVISDGSNNVYVSTSTMSKDFPVTSGCYQPNFGGGTQDGCVFKLDSNLHSLVWSTFLGGSKDDGAYSIDLGANNSVFICGGTLSPYFFKHDSSAYQDTLKGNSDAFICHLKNDGTGVIKATYLGTSAYDQAYFIRLDISGNVYVYGQTESTAFPVFNVAYSNPHSGNFITKFDDSLHTIIFSSVFGSGKGKPDISPTAFLIDKCERIYVSGWGGLLDIYHPTFNKLGLVYNMPISNDAFQKVTLDSADFWAAVFEKGMDSLLYGSYFGGGLSGEHVDGGTSRFDQNGIMYQSVCGGCEGNSDFPTTPGAWSQTNNSKGCNNLLFKVDLKILPLKAAFITPVYNCLSVALKITESSVGAQTYLWDFGDGSPQSTDSLPNHTYTIPGTYTVRLIVTNLNSCMVRDTVIKQITVYKVAKASFAIQNDSCTRTLAFLQTGESSTTSWDFGDGSHSNAYNGLHTYAKPGRYTIKLLVDSGTSCADSFMENIRVTGLYVGFTDSFAACHPNLIYFKDKSIGAVKSYKWYLPFASVDTVKNPVFNFNGSSGSYAVSLIATDSTGCSDTVIHSITVYSAPKALFTDTVYPCSSKVFLKNESVGIYNFKWILGDGSTSTADTLTHNFWGDSIITISLVTDTGLPCSDTLKKIIKINYPKAGYKYGIDTCTGAAIFTNTSANAASALWKFDASDSAAGTNAAYLFAQKGKYPVKLIVTSAAGCKDSITQAVDIKNSKRVLNIPNVFTPNGDALNNIFTITGLNPCKDYELSIYNRWGQLFYHSIGNSFVWDGVFHGNKVPEGVYYYVFDGSEKGQLTGTITVIY